MKPKPAVVWVAYCWDKPLSGHEHTGRLWVYSDRACCREVTDRPIKCRLVPIPRRKGGRKARK